MSRYGTVALNSAASLLTSVVQSSEPSDLAALANNAIAAIPGTYAVIDLALAGAGDGTVFTITIEAGLKTDLVDGGFNTAPSVICYAAATAEELLIQHDAVVPGAGNVADSQSAGSSKGQLFMGMLVLGTPTLSGATGTTGPTGRTGATGPTGQRMRTATTSTSARSLTGCATSTRSTP